MNFERKTRQILIILHYVPLYLPLKLSLFIGIARTERKPKWTDNWTISFANVFTEMKTRPLFNSNLQIFIIHKIFYFNLISSPSKTQGIFFFWFFFVLFCFAFYRNQNVTCARIRLKPEIFKWQRSAHVSEKRAFVMKPKRKKNTIESHEKKPTHRIVHSDE